MEIRSNNKAKHRSQKFAFGIFRLLSLCIVLILFAILGFIIYKGIGAISWDFITSAPTDGMTGGGIWPAIVGTFYLMVGSALFAFPIGEIGKSTRLNSSHSRASRMPSSA